VANTKSELIEPYTRHDVDRYRIQYDALRESLIKTMAKVRRTLPICTKSAENMPINRTIPATTEKEKKRKE